MFLRGCKVKQRQGHFGYQRPFLPCFLVVSLPSTSGSPWHQLSLIYDAISCLDQSVSTSTTSAASYIKFFSGPIFPSSSFSHVIVRHIAIGNTFPSVSLSTALNSLVFLSSHASVGVYSISANGQPPTQYSSAADAIILKCVASGFLFSASLGTNGGIFTLT